jgi:hypothetical protein
MKSLRILLCIIFAAMAVAAWSQPPSPRIITFDVPGAGTVAGQGTLLRSSQGSPR